MSLIQSIKNPIFTNTIVSSVDENYRVRTIKIDHNLENAKPGQFVLVWIPTVGERPMSIGDCDPLTISVANVGKVSAEICKLKKGDKISYRGPFGNPFTIPDRAKRILVVGGGYGVVPMYFLSKNAKSSKTTPFAVVGGRTDKDIIYRKQLESVCSKVFVTTDDGSAGEKGNVMVVVNRLLASEKEKFDCIYACGPERMMYAVAQACKQSNVPCQVSVERYMKCGTGVCGSCVINGRITCLDGPVLSGVEALSLSEFGKSHRDASGTKHEW
ncbi:dihydroorotate dehydrogenase electron transfer subunit [Candidatus Micrarchaeota archaeon]|nr:dihydroorotate dehydrogenase electron transfer subunit [Candidatus Micrarchaeota archaeon]